MESLEVLNDYYHRGNDPSRRSGQRLPIAYQIDFKSIDGGRRVKAAKRNVQWVFGFCDEDALNAGEVGAACRGDEHQVNIEWSITSGRQLVFIDKIEVYSCKSRSENMEVSSSLNGNQIRVIGTVNDRSSHGTRNFDLFVGGRSYFDCPKIFELGIAQKGRSGRSPESVSNRISRGEGSVRRKSMSRDSSLQSGESGQRRKSFHAGEKETSLSRSEGHTHSRTNPRQHHPLMSPLSRSDYIPCRGIDVSASMLSTVKEAKAVPRCVSYNSFNKSRHGYTLSNTKGIPYEFSYPKNAPQQHDKQNMREEHPRTHENLVNEVWCYDDMSTCSSLNPQMEG